MELVNTLNTRQFERFCTTLDTVFGTGRLPESDEPFVEVETRAMGHVERCFDVFEVPTLRPNPNDTCQCIRVDITTVPRRKAIHGPGVSMLPGGGS